MTTPQSLLQQAVEHHQGGRPAEAAVLYRAILVAEPWEVNALHLLGLVRWRSGDPAAGARLIARALRLNTTLEAAYINIANLHREQEEFPESLRWLEQGVAALPMATGPRELLCMLSHDWSVKALDGDPAVVRERARRCLAHIVGAPVFTRRLYDLLEPQLRVALMAGDKELAEIYVRLRNRHDFGGVAAQDTDVFTVDMLDFPDFCSRTGARTIRWTPPAERPTDTTLADYPGYLHDHVKALVRAGDAPLGVALDAPVEVIQGFYVKDNYESFVLSDRRAMLCENKLAVIRGAHIPLIGVTPGAKEAAIRLPRPLYRTLEIADPIIFVPSTPNYWHFMVEVLPMLMLRDEVPETRDRPILLFDVRRYQYEMLDLIGVPASQILDPRRDLGPETNQVLYRLARATIPSQVPYPVAYRWLRDRLLPRIRPDRPAHPKRVFLSRRSAYPKHRIANDTEVGDLLARHGFTVVLPETLSVLETIEMIAGAEMVVAPIGAGTSNHVFLPPHGSWIHLNSPDFFHPASPWNRQMGTQATLTGHFRHLTGRFVGDPAGFPTRDVDRLEIPIEIDLDALERIVEEAEERLARDLS
ncbi:glycosyltransferase 61 family protein [Azospirillum doebereinerae]